MTVKEPDLVNEFGTFDQAISALDEWRLACERDIDRLAKLQAIQVQTVTPEMWHQQLVACDDLIRTTKKLVETVKKAHRHQAAIVAKGKQFDAALRKTVCNDCGRKLGIYEAMK